MTTRITKADLESLARRINDACGWPHEPYALKDGKVLRTAEGRLIPNGGCVYLAGAYGGWKFEQMCEGGGSRDLLSSGYATKRELFERGQAFLAGVEART